MRSLATIAAFDPEDTSYQVTIAGTAASIGDTALAKAALDKAGYLDTPAYLVAHGLASERRPVVVGEEGVLVVGVGGVERADELARTLSQGTWTHDHPIPPPEAKALGLRVSTDMPAEVLELMTLYPQPVRTQPSVEYLPRPRSLRERPRL